MVVVLTSMGSSVNSRGTIQSCDPSVSEMCTFILAIARPSSESLRLLAVTMGPLRFLSAASGFAFVWNLISD